MFNDRSQHSQAAKSLEPSDRRVVVVVVYFATTEGMEEYGFESGGERMGHGWGARDRTSRCVDE